MKISCNMTSNTFDHVVSLFFRHSLYIFISNEGQRKEVSLLSVVDERTEKVKKKKVQG